MTSEEERDLLREQVAQRDDQIAQRDARIEHLEAALEQQSSLMQQMQPQISSLTQQVQAWQERQAKDSHNSSLPPSSDRFTRKTRSLRKKSEKKAGGQEGHRGTNLAWSSLPDEIIEQSVEQCEACQHDLRAVAACHDERRQVHDVPPPRQLVQEYRVEHKQCPVCQHITSARFPQDVAAPIQYGPTIGAVAVYLVRAAIVAPGASRRGQGGPVGSPDERRHHLHP